MTTTRSTDAAKAWIHPWQRPATDEEMRAAIAQGIVRYGTCGPYCTGDCQVDGTGQACPDVYQVQAEIGEGRPMTVQPWRLHDAIINMTIRYGQSCQAFAYARPGTPEEARHNRAASRRLVVVMRLTNALAEVAR